MRWYQYPHFIDTRIGSESLGRGPVSQSDWVRPQGLAPSWQPETYHSPRRLGFLCRVHRHLGEECQGLGASEWREADQWGLRGPKGAGEACCFPRFQQHWLRALCTEGPLQLQTVPRRSLKPFPHSHHLLQQPSWAWTANVRSLVNGKWVRKSVCIVESVADWVLPQQWGQRVI